MTTYLKIKKADFYQVETTVDGKAAFFLLKGDFDQRTAALRKSAARARKKLTNLFHFCGEVLTDGQALLMLVTELTLNPHCARFIGCYGCKEYYQCNKELLFYERQREIIQKWRSWTGAWIDRRAYLMKQKRVIELF